MLENFARTWQLASQHPEFDLGGMVALLFGLALVGMALNVVFSQR